MGGLGGIKDARGLSLGLAVHVKFCCYSLYDRGCYFIASWFVPYVVYSCVEVQLGPSNFDAFHIYFSDDTPCPHSARLPTACTRKQKKQTRWVSPHSE